MTKNPPSSQAISLLEQTIALHFDSKTSKVGSVIDKDALLTLAFGQKISDVALIKLCGAPSASKLSLSYKKASTSGESVPEGVHVDIDNPAYFDYPMTLVFFKDSKNRIAVYIKLVVCKKLPHITAVAGLMIEVMRRAWGTELNLYPNFHMLAAGGRTWEGINGSNKRWDGFAVWARYGFDMQLTHHTTSMFKHFPYVPPLAGQEATCKDLSGLLSLDQGLDFWDLVGYGWYMHFDSNLTSYSVKTLNSYLARKYP
jgi:hypothetical protein